MGYSLIALLTEDSPACATGRQGDWKGKRGAGTPTGPREASFIRFPTVRRTVSDTVPDPAEALLTSEPLMAHFATSVGDRPHAAPVWYVYDGGVVELVTTGRKLRNVRENPRIALSVQKDEAGTPEWTVTLLGTATVVDDEEAFREANRRINRKYGVDEDAHSENTLVRIDVGTASYRTYD